MAKSPNNGYNLVALRKKFLFLILFSWLLLWEILSRTRPSLRFVLPPPSAILMTLFELRERFALHTWFTFKEMLFGFALALAGGCPLAWLMFRFKTMRSLLQPCFVLIQCIPMFTLAPLMVIWLGWGMAAIVLPTALMIFFPLTLNLYQGLKQTPPPLVEFFQLSGATHLQTLFKLRIPAALPHIFSGLRLSAAIAGIGAVAGEWAGAQHGLGILMLESRRNSDLEITFAALLCLSLLTLSFYGMVLLAESFLTKKRKLSPLLPLLLCCFVTSCAPPKQTTLLLDWLPNPNHIPLYVGVEKGFFRDENIHLTILKQFDNGGGVSYLTSGKADLILGHLPGMLKACSLGADIQIVGVLIPLPLRALIYRADLKVIEPKDLTQYRLGYCIGGPDTTFLDYLLKTGEITPSLRKNVSSDLIAAMGTHAVDFIYGGFWNIEPHQLRSFGLETAWFPIEKFQVPPYQELLVIGRASSPPFQRALEKSIAYCKEHPDEAFQCYLASTPDKSECTKRWEAEAWKQTVPLLPATQEIDLALIERFYAWQTAQGILKHPVDVPSLISSTK